MPLDAALESEVILNDVLIVLIWLIQIINTSNGR